MTAPSRIVENERHASTYQNAEGNAVGERDGQFPSERPKRVRLAAGWSQGLHRNRQRLRARIAACPRRPEQYQENRISSISLWKRLTTLAATTAVPRLMTSSSHAAHGHLDRLADVTCVPDAAASCPAG